MKGALALGRSGWWRAADEPQTAALIRIDYGIAEQLPGPDASADLIWCRDVLEHVQDLEAAFGEFRRILSLRGRHHRRRADHHPGHPAPRGMA
jgi:ubiquinone/menaquinone biosynthesis C-methylase UbiE